LRRKRTLSAVPAIYPWSYQRCNHVIVLTIEFLIPPKTEWWAECLVTGTEFFMKQMSAATQKEGAALIPAELLVREYPGQEAAR
jgi:hypothetical protein